MNYPRPSLPSVISTVLHPLLVPSYVFAFVLLFMPELITPIQPKAFPILFGIVFVFTLVLPLVAVALLFKLGLVESVGMLERKDRLLPHLVCSTIYVILTWFFYSRLEMVPILYHIVGAMALCMVFVGGINLRWKISAHSTAMGGMFAFFVFAVALSKEEHLAFFLLLLAFLSGVVMYARMRLQIHSLRQAVGGFLLGFSIGCGVFSNIF